MLKFLYLKQGGGDKTGDALAGAIIGGTGNNVGDAQNGGVLGAVIGGMIGHNNSKAGDSPNVIVGYLKRTLRTTTHITQIPEELILNKVTVQYGDPTYSSQTQNVMLTLVTSTIRLKSL